MTKRFVYLIVSDRNPTKILSSASSIRKAKQLRRQFAEAMGQGAPTVHIVTRKKGVK